MQRIAFKLLFSFCFLFSGSIQAQNYHVCDVSKNVCVIGKRIKTPVKKMQVINIKERLEIPQYGYIVLIDSTNMKSCRIDKPCCDILKNIISANKATIEQLTERYFRYIWGKMCGGKEVAANSTKEQLVTVTYRDVDSVRTDSVARSMAESETPCKTVECKADNSKNIECCKAQCADAPCKDTPCTDATCREAQCADVECKEHKCLENK